MKKKLVVTICILAFLAVIAFGFMHFTGGPSDVAQKANTNTPKTQASNTTPKEDKNDINAEDEEYEDIVSEKNTLLIYMLGSDLESRSSAGTSDLTEMVNSGIDLEKSNVLVYTGGSQKWHNELVNNENNSIIRLTNAGFITESTFPSASMGTAESLTEFLTYGYENYPAENFALILWNHGNGPLIGYGKDMLFDNDSLTLSEMKSALSASPFNSSNKLSWVGFDACLMSSAELACVWSEYADYLVASQEIEPSFGWNYDILKHYGLLDTKTFLGKLINTYLSTCEAYYDERGYENRDTTLACMDLAYAPSLKNAIDDLFAVASTEVSAKYNTLAKKRVETRALGRASTGSEYDLIDLADMATQLESIYPERAKKIKDIVSDMVIKNGTNADLCCGMSIYYPFYNKYYYENSWRDIYSDLGVFANYGSYLDNYQTIWLNDDKLESYASSTLPQMSNANSSKTGFFIPGQTVQYNLQLTQSQNENYADAKYYILEQTNGNLYHPVMSSENVINNNGILTADFNGKAIYATDRYGKTILPVATEYDTVGNISRYSILTLAKNISQNNSNTLDFHLTLNTSNHVLSTSALLPHNSNAGIMNLVGGKQAETSINEWDIFSFGFLDYKYLTRYDNGAVRPIDEWVEQTYFSLDDIPRRDGFELKYLPLTDEKYYFIFEITDTQGNKYCSEMLPIRTNTTDVSSLISAQKPQDIDVAWNEGEKITLFETDGVSIKIKKALSYDKPVYRLEYENTRESAVSITFDKVIFNGEYYNDFSDSTKVDANSIRESTFDIFPDSNAVNLGEISEITNITGTFKIADESTASTLLKNQQVNIAISEEASLGLLSEHYELVDTSVPFSGALAQRQVLYESNDLRVTLICLCYGFSNQGYICYENLSSENIYTKTEAYSVNGITVARGYQTYEILPKTKVYDTIYINKLYFPNSILPQIEDLKLLLSVSTTEDVWSKPDISVWLPVTLSQHGTDDNTYNQTGRIIYDEHDIQIVLDSYTVENDVPTWKATVVNNSNHDISLLDTNIDDSSSGTFSVDRYGVGAKQKAYINIKYYGQNYDETLVGKEFTFKIHILDFYESDILFYGDTPITLTIEEKPKEATETIDWKNGDQIKIAENGAVSVYIKKAKYIESQIPVYALAVVNNTDSQVRAYLGDIVINDTTSVQLDVYTSAPPNETALSAIEPKNEIQLGLIDEITSIKGTIEITDDSYSTILKPQKVIVNMYDDTKLTEIGKYYDSVKVLAPVYDAVAENQLLWETNDLRVSLVHLGETNTYYNLIILAENLSDEDIKIDIDAFGINGFTEKDYNLIEVPAHTKTCKYTSLPWEFPSIETLSIHMAAWKGKALGVPYDNTWAQVKLTEHGKATEIAYGNDIIFDKNGIKVIYDGYESEHPQNKSPVWNLTIINDSDEDICLKFDNYSVSTLEDTHVGAHQHRKIHVYHSDKLVVESITFKFLVYDFYSSEILTRSDNSITLFKEHN